jgi:hypothetical protein
MRSGAGYLCQSHPNHQRKQDYSLKEIDVVAAYVIPENVWYLIPAAFLLGKHRKWIAMLCPLTTPKKKACYCWEGYRDNWELLTKSRKELTQLRIDVEHDALPPHRHDKRRPRTGKGTSLLVPSASKNQSGFSR